MDKRLQAIADNFDKLKIDLDDSFQFHCTMCGKCCTHREDILLNPFDIYRMSKELHLMPLLAFQKYCDSYIGKTSKMVLVIMRTVGPNNACPLLFGKKCTIHKGKPTVCALFPLGRTILNFNDDSEEQKVQYILQETNCGNKTRTHTVREWLAGFDLDAEDEFFITWTQVVMTCGSIIKAVEKQFSPDICNTLATTILACLYLNYDTSQPFPLQFKKNVKDFFDKMKEIGLLPEKSE